MVIMKWMAAAYHWTHSPSRLTWLHGAQSLFAICRPSGCTVASGVVIVGVIVGVCNRSQMRTSKCTRLIFGVSIGLDPG